MGQSRGLGLRPAPGLRPAWPCAIAALQARGVGEAGAYRPRSPRSPRCSRPALLSWNCWCVYL